MMVKVQEFTPFYNKLIRQLLPICFLFFGFVAESLAYASFSENKVAFLKTGGEKARVKLATQVGTLGETPVIFIDNSMGTFEAEVGQDSIQQYYVDGYFFTPGASVFLNVSDASGSFTISTSSNSGFGSTLELIADGDGVIGSSIWVKYAPADEGPHSATIDHSGPNAETKTLSVDGNVTTTPVEWLSFKARAVRGAIILDWATASEKNNSHFEVEISKNPVAGFEKIGRVNSKEGNSQSATHYNFEHYLGTAVGTYYFRLKQVDIDQAFDYSRIVAVEMAEVNGLKAKVAPNPINVSSQLSMAVAEAGELRVLILTMSGATVYSKTFALEAGANKIQLGLTDRIGHGVYMLSTEFKGRFSRLKLIKE